MDQTTNYKHQIDFLISNANDTSLIQPKQTINKKRRKKINCSECNKKRTPLNESHQICHVCYKTKAVYEPKLSGYKIIDDFIKHTQIKKIKKKEKLIKILSNIHKLIMLKKKEKWSLFHMNSSKA